MKDQAQELKAWIKSSKRAPGPDAIAELYGCLDDRAKRRVAYYLVEQIEAGHTRSVTPLRLVPRS